MGTELGGVSDPGGETDDGAAPAEDPPKQYAYSWSKQA